MNIEINFDGERLNLLSAEVYTQIDEISNNIKNSFDENITINKITYNNGEFKISFNNNSENDFDFENILSSTPYLSYCTNVDSSNIILGL